jgi:hypothetical protein
MRAIPDGLPPAVALTYCVPDVDGASVGPDSFTQGSLVSTYTVSERVAVTPAAFVADNFRVVAPDVLPDPVRASAVSRWAVHLL